MTATSRSPTPLPRSTSNTAKKAATAMSTRAMSVANVIATHFAEPPQAPGVLLRELRRRGGGRGGRWSPSPVGGRLGGGLARDPEDHGARDQEQEPGVAVQRQGDAGQEDGSCDGEEAEADQRPRPVSPVAEGGRRDRVLLALVGHDERRGGVDEDAGPAEEGEDDEADAEDGGVDLEVAGEAAADAGDHAIRAAALQAADLWDVCGCCVHGWRMACGGLRDHPE